MSIETISIEGRDVRVEVLGEAAATPILLLHGIGRSLEDWNEIAEVFARNYRVIRLDLPGFGYSTRAPGPVGLATIAAELPKVLDAVGEARAVHAIGNSLGGAIAMQMLADFPERVASTVLINSAGFGSSVTWLLRLLTLPGLGALATHKTTPTAARMFEKRIFVDPRFITPERVAHAVAIGNRPGAGAFMREMAQALGTWRGVRSAWREDLVRRVVALQRPALIVWGDGDRVLPPAHFENARQALPHAHSHMFASTGHMPQIERAGETAALISDFLAARQA